MSDLANQLTIHLEVNLAKDGGLKRSYADALSELPDHQVGKVYANYRTGEGDERCECCRFYVRGAGTNSNKCKLVTGRIRPEDTCDFFIPYAASDDPTANRNRNSSGGYDRADGDGGSSPEYSE